MKHDDEEHRQREKGLEKLPDLFKRYQQEGPEALRKELRKAEAGQKLSREKKRRSKT